MVVNAIIADADKNWCMALANELNVTKDFKVIKMINNGFKVISELERLKPKLIILDMDLPSISGLEIIQDIEKNNEINTEVIILTKKAINMSQVVGFKCVKCFLSKKEEFEKIILEIQNVANKISEKDVERQILDYLFDIGFSTKVQGTIFLKDCIKIFLSKNSFEYRMKSLIKEVASGHKIEEYKVKNNMYNSTRAAWDLGERNHIIDKLKLGAYEEPSPKKVISMSRYYIDM